MKYCNMPKFYLSREKFDTEKGVKRFSKSITKHIESLQELLLYWHHQGETENLFFPFKSWWWQHPGGQRDFKQQEAALQFYHAPQRGCHRVTIRPSVWPAELLLGMMQAQTHAKPRLCQRFEEKRVGEGDHNEYLKPFIQADLEKHRLPQRSVLLCSASPLVPVFTLGLRVC